MHSPAPAGVRRGALRRSPAPTTFVGEAVPRGGGGGLLPCGHRLVGVLPAQSALVLEFLQGPFRSSGCYGCVRDAHPVQKPVHRELGSVLGHVQVMSRGSTIGDGGDTTISSPGRSPKQPLPGMRLNDLHDPLHGRQACPEFIAFDQGVGQICPR